MRTCASRTLGSQQGHSVPIVAQRQPSDASEADARHGHREQASHSSGMCVEAASKGHQIGVACGAPVSTKLDIALPAWGMP